MSEIQEGKVTIITLPTRGRAAEPIPETEIEPLIENLDAIEDGQGVTNGRFFEKQHQAQAYGKKLLMAIEEKDPQYWATLGTSVIGHGKDKDGKPVGPFVVAIRKK